VRYYGTLKGLGALESVRVLRRATGTPPGHTNRAGMGHHRYIWAVAATLLAATAVVLGARTAIAPALEPAQFVDKAISLLEDDPSAWEYETRSVIRAAAVEVEANRDRSAHGYYVLALQYMRESNYNAAESLFKRAIAANPDWSWPYVGLGNLLGGFSLGRTEEAVAALRKAAELDPAWSRPHDSLAIILRMAGRIDEAGVAALRALELAPDNIATNTNYANLLVVLGRFDEAEHYYRRAIEIDPAHPKPYYNLACVFSLEGDVDRAVEYLERAIKVSGSLRLEARNDPDFDQIREVEAFRRLVYLEEFRDNPPFAAPANDTQPAEGAPGVVPEVLPPAALQ
jgi:Flp pilus assembly protein TadD